MKPFHEPIVHVIMLGAAKDAGHGCRSMDMKPATSGEPPFSTGYPVFPQALPASFPNESHYRLGFARTPAELEAVQKLRYEVFNLELGEGLDESHETGLDHDRFDPICHHLMIVDRKTDAVIGTYRMQTGEMALQHEGFYTADEFDLARMPEELRLNAVETGRACVHCRHGSSGRLRSARLANSRSHG